MKMKHVGWVAMTIALVACSGSDKNQLGDLPVVAHQVEVNGQQMTVCQLDLLKDTIDLPLSYWVEDFEAVKLDGRDEAYFYRVGVVSGFWRVCIPECSYQRIQSPRNHPKRRARRCFT